MGGPRRHVSAVVHQVGGIELEPADGGHQPGGAVRHPGRRCVPYAARRDAPRPGGLGADAGPGQSQRGRGAAGTRMPLRLAEKTLPTSLALRGRFHAHRGPGQHSR